MSSKKKKQEQIKKQKIKQERSNIIKKLYRECLSGGNLKNIKRVISENEYSIPELEEAIEVLIVSVSSALENNLASEAQDFIERIIEGKRFN